MKNQIGEQAKFWRDSSLSNLELLRATYITHSFARHTHETFAIGVVDAGVEEFTYQGTLHQAPADSIVIVHPGEVHTGQAGIPTGWTYRMFYPDVSLLQSAVGELSDRSCVIPYFPQPVIDDRSLANQLRHLHHALETSDSRLERESCWLWTVAQLVSRYAENRPAFRAIRQEQRVIQQVQDYLHTHYTHPISLEQLAKLADLKPLRLLRLFRQQVGLPPHAYLVQVRVAHAKSLLRMGETIVQVAANTGFSDQSHLTRHFKRLVGVTPGHYALGCKSC